MVTHQKIMDYFFKDYYFEESEAEISRKKVLQEEMHQLISMVEPLFFYALTWSLGANVDEEGRKKLSLRIKQTIMEDKVLLEKMKPFNFPENEGASLFDYEFDVKRQAYLPWDDRRREFFSSSSQ
jgi:hypothetical protein